MKKLHTTSLGYSGMDRPAQLIVWPGKPYPLGANWDGEGQGVYRNESKTNRALSVSASSPLRSVE